ncbi:MAG: hypothetical protein OEZ57_16005 [Nitrospirota bacterium]|nr:hypothetical protein [Nitrospirota bacterium]
MRFSNGIFFCFVFWMTFTSFNEAWAYLDPGTGSMVLQLLLGGVAGAVVVVKLYWEKVKNFFSREKLP